LGSEKSDKQVAEKIRRQISGQRRFSENRIVYEIIMQKYSTARHAINDKKKHGAKKVSFASCVIKEKSHNNCYRFIYYYNYITLCHIQWWNLWWWRKNPATYYSRCYVTFLCSYRFLLLAICITDNYGQETRVIALYHTSCLYLVFGNMKFDAHTNYEYTYKMYMKNCLQVRNI